MATIISLPLSLLLAVETTAHIKSDANRAKAVTRRTAVTLLILYISANAVALIVTANRPSIAGMSTYTEVAAHFGLESGKQYPLNLGSRFSGTSGHMSVSGGAFYVYGSGSWSPATAVSLGFKSLDDRSWILEVPTSRITFIQEDGATPSMAVNLGDEWAAGLGFAQVNAPAPCTVRFDYGWWHCTFPEGNTTTQSVLPEAEKAGLAPVVSQAFTQGGATAEITLTPQQFDALLKNQTPP